MEFSVTTTDAIQERIRGVAGLEAWCRPKIIEPGIDGFATRDRRKHLRRAVTQTERLHQDQRAIMCQKRDAEVQLKDAI